jgi:siroheme synthase-like protein
VVVSPEVLPEVERLAEEGSVVWLKREYEPSDLEGKFLVIACTDDTDTNIRIFEDAERRAMLANIVDVPPLCNFILPAIVRTGPLAIAISTAGASPALAKRMKDEISGMFGEEYARLAVILNDTRGWAKGTLPTYQDRKAFFEGIVNGDPDPIALLREGREDELHAIVADARRAAEAQLQQA